MVRWLVVMCGVLLATGCKDTCVPTAENDCGASSQGVAGVAAAGAVPSGSHLSLDCSPFNVPAFASTDCLYSHVQRATADSEPVRCTVKLADRTGLVIGAATQVSFMAEAGDVSPVATSPAYDPAVATIEQAGLGHAVGWLEIFGAPLPADVPPMPGEPSVTRDFGCGSRIANPRDGYVTVIAWVRGEEGFADLDRNGRYDAGEPFADAGEPFVDVDDDGKWNAGEWYLDVNGNGKWDGPNGQWDADTVLWTQTRVLFSGLLGGGSPLSRFTSADFTSDRTTFSVAVGATQNYGVFLTDDRLNPLATDSTIDATSALGRVTPTLSSNLPLANLVGRSFRLLYCPSDEITDGCRDGTIEHGCTTAPCFVVPDVGGCRAGGCNRLITGEYVGLYLEGVSSGPDVVTVSATVDVYANDRLNHITSALSLPGTCTP